MDNWGPSENNRVLDGVDKTLFPNNKKDPAYAAKLSGYLIFF